MLKPKSGSKSKKSKKKIKHDRRQLEKALIIAFLALALIAASALFLVHYDKNRHLGAIEATDNKYKSLDLSQARQAIYSNSAIRITKNLGVSHSVKHYIVRFKVPQDGLDEYAYMTLPAGTPSAGSLPTIILCHGYAIPASYSTTRSYLSDMEFYSENGYAVIKPDFRGQGLSRAEGLPEGAYFSMAYNTDLMNLIAAVKKTSYLNSGEISLWGHSMGAYLALRTAVVSPDIKDLILLSLPGDIIQDAEASVIPGSDATNYVAAKIRAQQIGLHGQPSPNLTYWDKASPSKYLSLISANVQIHVASDDQIVSPAISQTLSGQLDKLKKPHALYVYEGAHHGLVTERSLIWQRSLQLLKSKG